VSIPVRSYFFNRIMLNIKIPPKWFRFRNLAVLLLVILVIVEISESATNTRRRFRRPSTSVRKSVSQSKDQVVSASVNRFRTRKRPNKDTSDNAIAAATKISKKDKEGYKVVCYYTNWSQYRPKTAKFTPEDIIPDLCTHVIFAFGWLKKGKLSSYESNDETKDGKIGLYDRIDNLKKANPKLKTLLAVGGWSFGTQKFKEMTATRYARQTFIYSAIPFLRNRNFDGLDIDWEYPKGQDDKKNYVLLLKGKYSSLTLLYRTQY
ncbi:glycoside hydrolase, partial [Oryctes borbonicus]